MTCVYSVAATRCLLSLTLSRLSNGRAHVPRTARAAASAQRQHRREPRGRALAARHSRSRLAGGGLSPVRGEQDARPSPESDLICGREGVITKPTKPSRCEADAQAGAMPYMTDNPNTGFVVRERVRNGELMQLKALIKEGIDFNECFLAPGPTIRGYTPLHIAAFGTQKPNYDRDIVEAILQAAKKAGKEAESAIRAAKDHVDGETALDLVSVARTAAQLVRTLGHVPPVCAQAKQRLAKVDANPPKPGADDKDFLDEKRPTRVANGRLPHPAAGSSPGRPGATVPGCWLPVPRVPPCPFGEPRRPSPSHPIVLTCVPLPRAGRGWTR